MKYLFVVLMALVALTGCEKAKTPEQTLEQTPEQKSQARRDKAMTVYLSCVNNNLETRDFSARAKAHCKDLQREAASRY